MKAVCGRRRWLSVWRVATALLLAASILRPNSSTASDQNYTPGSKAGEDAVPLPPHRPIDLKPTPVQPRAQPSQAETNGSNHSVCALTFVDRGGTVLPSPPTKSVGQCAIQNPITFQHIGIADGAHIELDSAVTIRCSLALELQAWAREDLGAIKANSKVVKIIGVSGQACRPRNGIPGGQISEHASGNAIDLSGLRFADGRTIMVTAADETSRSQRQAIQKSACARFMTVLGPGSDASHKDHLHLDMRQRANGYRICQWSITPS